jgi:hypothetical protein
MPLGSGRIREIALVESLADFAAWLGPGHQRVGFAAAFAPPGLDAVGTFGLRIFGDGSEHAEVRAMTLDGVRVGNRGSEGWEGVEASLEGESPGFGGSGRMGGPYSRLFLRSP